MFAFKTNKKVLNLLATLFIVLAVSACSDDDDDSVGSSTSAGTANNNNSPSPAPGSPDAGNTPSTPVFALDESRQASGIATPGAEKRVSVMNADGVIGELIIPAGAVPQDTEITITPVVSLPDSGLEPSSIVAFHFGPEGLRFPVGVKFEFELPELTGTPPTAFIYSGNAEAITPAFFEQNGRRITMTLAHFSGAGVGQGELAQSHNQELSDLEKAALALGEALYPPQPPECAPVEDQEGNEIPPPSHCPTPPDPEQVEAKLRAYADEVLKVFTEALQVIEESPELSDEVIDVATAIWWQWLVDLQLAAVIVGEDVVAAESQMMEENVLTGWLETYEVLYEFCETKMTFAAVQRMLDFAARAREYSMGIYDERLEYEYLQENTCLRITFDEASIPDTVEMDETVEVRIRANVRFGDNIFEEYSEEPGRQPKIELVLESENFLSNFQDFLFNNELFTTNAKLTSQDGSENFSSINIVARAYLKERPFAELITGGVTISSDGESALELIGRGSHDAEPADPVLIEVGEDLFLTASLFKGNAGAAGKTIIFERQSTGSAFAVETTDEFGVVSVTYPYPLAQCGEDKVIARASAPELGNPSASINVEFECDNRPKPWVSDLGMSCNTAANAKGSSGQWKSEYEDTAVGESYSDASEWDYPSNFETTSSSSTSDSPASSSANCSSTLSASYSPQTGKISINVSANGNTASVGGSNSGGMTMSGEASSLSEHYHLVRIELPGSNYNYSFSGSVSGMGTGHPDEEGFCTVSLADSHYEEADHRHEVSGNSQGFDDSGHIAVADQVTLEATCTSRSPADNEFTNTGGNHSLTVNLELTPN